MSRSFGTLCASSMPSGGREEIGSEGHECAYCGVSLAEARCLRRRRSTGFGWANEVMDRFCDRRCRGMFDERGPRDRPRGDGVRGRLPTDRDTLAPYQDDSDADGSASTAGTEVPA